MEGGSRVGQCSCCSRQARRKLVLQFRCGVKARSFVRVIDYVRLMTLVLCCTTPRYLLQASDRRLTYPNGTIAEDARNKAVFATGRAVWSYTGIARIGRPLTPTDEWLLDVLASADSDLDASERIAEGAAKAVREVHGPVGYGPQQRKVLRRLAFVSSFYGDQRVRENGTLEPCSPVPIVRIVSNFASADASGKLEWLAESLQDFSTWTAGPLGEGQTPRVLEFGQQLSSGARAELHRGLRRCDQHETGVEPYARLVARAIQRCHDDGNALVGRNAMVAWMRVDASPHIQDGALYDAPLVPLLADLSEQDFFQRPKNEPSTGRGYFYLPGDAGSREHFAPSWVGDGVAVKGMRMAHQGPGREASVTAVVRTLPPLN